MDSSFLGLGSNVWAAIAAIASSISAFAAYKSATAQRKATDAEIIERLNAKKEEFDQKLNDARKLGWDEEDDSPHPWNFVVLAWFNHIELTAQLFNDKLIGKSARKFIKPLLIEWLRAIADKPKILELMLGAISGPTTFAEIRKFTRSHKRYLQQLNKSIEDNSI